MKKNERNTSIEAYTFEKYITTLLQALAEKQNKKFISEYKFEKIRFSLDGYAPNGLEDIRGPLAIEIKYTTHYQVLNNTIKKLLKLFPNFNILIISPIKSKKSFTNISRQVTIWDLNDIKELGNRFSQVQFQFSDEFIPNLLEYTRNPLERLELVKKSTQEAKFIEYNTNKDKYLADIKKAYKNGKLVLFLGAGISKPKLPDWKELIEKLIIEFLKSQGEHIKSLDIDDDDFKSLPYITLGRYIKKGFGDVFTRKLKNALYKGYKHSIDSSSNVYSIAALCTSKRIHSIVTYNLMTY